MSHDRWSRAALTGDGFSGWVRWSACPAALNVIDKTAGGVYVVYRDQLTEPDFLPASPAGTWRGDPSISPARLVANWVPDAHVLNIGKANQGRLRARLKEYIAFGRGGRARHSGGRLIWQLANSQDLLAAWKVLPTDVDPVSVEKQMIADHRSDYAKPPFANDPDMDGR